MSLSDVDQTTVDQDVIDLIAVGLMYLPDVDQTL